MAAICNWIRERDRERDRERERERKRERERERERERGGGGVILVETDHTYTEKDRKDVYDLGERIKRRAERKGEWASECKK